MTGRTIIPFDSPIDTFMKALPFRELFITLLALGATACSAARVESNPRKTSDSTNAHTLADVIDAAQAQCPSRTHAPEDATVSPSRVFTEIFLLEVPAEANFRLERDSLAALPRVPGAKLLSVPHIIAEFETAQTMDLGQRIYPPGATLDPGLHFASMSVLPHLGASGGLIIDVDVVLETAEPGQSPPAQAHVRNTFALSEQRTGWLAAPVPGYSKGTLLLGVKAHPISGQADLRDIFECKMQQRQRSLARWQSPDA